MKWVNVTATVELLLPLPEGKEVTPQVFQYEMETKGHWKHISNVKIVHTHNEP